MVDEEGGGWVWHETKAKTKMITKTITKTMTMTKASAWWWMRRVAALGKSLFPLALSQMTTPMRLGCFG